jgi:peptidoglycan/xylan/chitin deacetylase (PgdA/CDA1 family)
MLCACTRRGLFGAVLLAADGDAPIEPRLRMPASSGVALTLDACPGGFDERIATALVASNIRATIFVTSVWMRMNPAAVAYLLANKEIFALENHGKRHVPPVLGSRRIFGIEVAGDFPAIQQEVEGGARAIEQAAGRRPTWYRAATGFYSRSIIPRIEAMGFAIAGYSVNADEGASLPAHAVAARIAAARAGDVIVAHINQPHRASGAGVVEGARMLQGAGMNFVHLAGQST